MEMLCICTLQQAPSLKVPLSTSLEQMTREDVQALGVKEQYVSINPQLLVALRDYALEEPE